MRSGEEETEVKTNKRPFQGHLISRTELNCLLISFSIFSGCK